MARSGFCCILVSADACHCACSPLVYARAKTDSYRGEEQTQVSAILATKEIRIQL